MATRSEPIAADAVTRVGRLDLVRRRPAVAAAGGVAALALVLVASVALGPVWIAPADTIAIIAHRVFDWPVHVAWAATSETIVMELRLPRALSAMAVGASLALAGAALQGLLRNPLADPYVLGTASGAALGAAIGVLLPIRGVLFGFGLVQALAFAGALLAVTLVWHLSRSGTLGSLTGLLLTGYAVSSLLAAGLAVTMYLAGSDLREIVFFLLGGLGGASWQQLWSALPLMSIGAIVILGRTRVLNGLLLGEETASHLGMDVGRERVILLAAASLVTAAAVSIAGLVGFVGLVVPHVVRLLVGPNARFVLPLAALFGASFLAVSDLLARVLGEIPVGVLTALVGAPFFLSVLRHAREGYDL